jgi:Cof subfamily protein (haloacid dehalogenase superfamily)
MTPSWRHVRLVATDLDGTLLRSDGRLSARTREAVLAADAAGLATAFLTARPLRGTRELLLDAGFRGALATSNGAVCLDLQTAEHLYEPRTLPSGSVHELLGWAFAADPDCVVALDTGARVLATGDLGATGWPYEVVPASTLRLSTAVTKVLVQPSGSVTDLLERARTLPPYLATATVSTRSLVELGPPGTDKAGALRAIARRAGVPLRDVLAIGDMPNDLSMLTAAGRAATPQNGHPSLRAVDGVVVTGANDADGVADLLHELVGSRASG